MLRRAIFGVGMSLLLCAAAFAQSFSGYPPSNYVNVGQGTSAPPAWQSTVPTAALPIDNSTITVNGGGKIQATGAAATTITNLTTTVSGATNGNILEVTNSGCSGTTPCLSNSSLAGVGGIFDTLCSSTVGQAWVRLTSGWGCTSLGFANPVWWGADSTGSSNSFTPIGSAIATGITVVFPCGTFKNSTSHFTATAGQMIRGAAQNCANILYTYTSDDLFQCATGGNHTTFRDLTIQGPAATTIPTSGYAINCSGGNNEHFENLEIFNGYNAINAGGANDVITGNRIENMYGTVIINGAAGGNINNNQLDNNSMFNGVSGTPTFLTSWPGASATVATNATIVCGSYYYLARVGGTTSASSSACSTHLVPTPMNTDIIDGSVTWQLIGNGQLVMINAGVQANIYANDITSPAQIGILVNGSQGVFIHDNNGIAGMIVDGIAFENTSQDGKVHSNLFSDIGRAETGPASSGFVIVDTTGNNTGVSILGNSFLNTVDAAIDWGSGGGNIQSNVIRGHNVGAVSNCAIQIYQATAGLNIELNNITSSLPGAICATGTSTFLSVSNNTVSGGTISVGSGGSVQTVNNN